MATFNYQALHIYSASSPNTFIATDDTPDVADDGELDAEFTIGDAADVELEDPTNGDAPFTPNVDYIGFIDFAGLSLPVGFISQLELPGPPSDLQNQFPDGAYVVIDPRDPTTITVPATLDLSGLDDGAYVTCFLADTAISTPTGSTPIDSLAIGDEILTADGRFVAVKWVGRQTVSTRFGAPDRLRLVRISAGALGDDLPLRDLCLTADHALLIDGLLVNAGALVNGTTITREPLDRFDGSYTVYHIETADHDVILAEGTPAESYVDYVGRQAFDNHAEYLALYGVETALPEMTRPRITAARHLPPALRARLGIDHAA